MTHMHADDRNRILREMAQQHEKAPDGELARNIAHEFRCIEGAVNDWHGTALDDWHDTLAPGFEKPRPWRIEGPMFAAAVLLASVTILCLAVIGLLALVFPGAFA